MSIFKLPTHKITMALVGLFLMAIFAIPSISLAIPDDGNGGAPPIIPLPHPISVPTTPEAPGAPAPVDPAPVVVENTAVVYTDCTGISKCLYEFVTTFFGVLTAAFGYFFDYTVEHFVIGFGDAYKNSGTGFVIDDLWGMVRNIFNLTLIFGLVYIGFQMILGLNNSAQRSIGYLVAAALLVNFSLFITKFIVDFSNLAATQIYQAMVGDVGGSISTTFTNIINLSNILNDSQENIIASTLGNIFGLMLVLVVTAFVFAAGAVMILLRYIGLNLYLVFSPLLFLGWVFPSMNGYSKKYWSGFLGKAFFAPAFMFMLYLSLRVIDGYGMEINPNDSVVAVFKSTPDVSALGMFSFYIMVIGFLLASLVVAQKMGATGADTAIAVGHNLRGRLQRGMGSATAGLLAAGGRTTIGALAHATTKNEGFKKFASSTWGGKKVYNAVAGVADSSFDVRKVGGVGKALGVGEGKKGGYTTRLKETAESNKKFEEALGTIDKDEAEKRAKETARSRVAEEAKSQAESELRVAEAMVQTRTSSVRTNINRLHEELKTADGERKKEIVQEIIANKAVIENIEDENRQQIAKLKENEKKATEEAKSVLEEETARIEYSNQINHIESLDRWTKRQEKYARMLAAGAGATAGIATGVATGMVLPALAVSILASGSTIGSINHSRQDVKSAQKEYGKNGTKKKKSKERQNAIADLAKEVAKEKPASEAGNNSKEEESKT